MKFTQADIDALPIPEKDSVFWDQELKRFGLRVKPSGQKSYMIQYRNADGVSRKKTIGDAYAIKLKDARNLARQMLTQVAQGQDPAEAAKVQRAAWTVIDAIDHWRTVYVPARRLSKGMVENCERHARNSIIPAMGKRKIKDVTKAEVMQLQGSMANQPANANRCLAFLSKLFALAIDAGERPDNPVHGIERYPENRRNVHLNVDELNRVYEALGRQEDQNQANCVRLIMLTGCRRSEAFTAEWSQFNFDTNTWTLPLTNTKQRKIHNRQITPLAAEWLLKHKKQQAKNQINSRWLFPQAQDSQKHIVDVKRFWKRVLNDATIDECRIHDLRHTFASLLLLHGDNVSIATIGALLGHQNLSTTMRYAHVADQAARSAVSVMGSLIK